MSWMDQIGNVLQQYSGGAARQSDSVHQDFDEVARSVPPETLAGGISEMFRSHQTPPFGQMVGRLFENSDGSQKAGLLNRLISSVGPSLMAQFEGGGPMAGLGGLLRGGTLVTPEQDDRLPSEAVRQIAEHAEKRDPSIVDQIGSFYAQHPTLVKTVGAAALTVALTRMARR